MRKVFLDFRCNDARRASRGLRVHQGPVVYCAFEGQTGIQARVAAFRERYLQNHSDKIPFYLEPVTLDLVRDRKALITAIEKQVGAPPCAVVLDTLNRSIHGSESSDEDMTAYIAATDAIREAFNCAVPVVHHCGIDASRPRGHTSLTGAADAQLAVKRDAVDNVIVTVEWMKDGANGQAIASALEIVTVGADEDGEELTSCVVVPAQGSAAKRQSVPVAARLALDQLKNALADEGVSGTNSHVPPGAKTVPVSLWRSYCYASTVTCSDDPDSKRKAFNRAVQKLQGINAIGVWNDVVWMA
jgi:hypothetical protein